MFSKELPGLVSLFVGFSVLRDYGVEKVFVLENGNTDSSQRNIVYIVDGEDAVTVQEVAGKLGSTALEARHGTVQKSVLQVWPSE